MKAPASLRHALRSLLLAACLLPASCLEFDGQEVFLHHDVERDRIDVLIVYRGLYAESGTAEDDMKKALQDLDATRRSGEFCFWYNWPFTVDLTRERPAPVRALMDHVDVENGGLFTDPQGELCGYQFVRVRDAQAFLKKVNTLLELAVQAALASGIDLRGPEHRLHQDTRELLLEHLRAGERLLALEDNRIELRLPLAEADLRYALDQMEQHFLSNACREMAKAEERAAAAGHTFGDARERYQELLRGAPSFRFFWDNPISIERRPGLVRVALGTAADGEEEDGGSPELHLRKARDGAYDPRLLEQLRARGEAIEDGVPDPELARRFAAFRAREPVLPPGLAELRDR